MRLLLCALLGILLASCSGSDDKTVGKNNVEEKAPVLKYGLEIEKYEVVPGEIGKGDFFGSIMENFGVGANQVQKILKASEGVFDVRKIKLGSQYEVLVEKDTLGEAAFFVYELDNLSYAVVSLKDSLYARIYEKEVEAVLKRARATISTSLWNDVQQAGIPPLMALRLSDVYDCTIDFFGLQKGDWFEVMYEELMHEGEYMGLGKIYYAQFNHAGKTYDAIRFNAGENSSVFWNGKGESLKKAFLKAPLNFTRISSRFTYARKHPVLKIVRPHTGVDYAAPSGTPVVALGDGVVTHRGWAGGGGNTIKIKHPGNYVTSYMHLRGYAKGIVKGSRVTRGQLIGYVGSTGLSTGPHLDFRVYKNGKPIDPLKMESPSVEPVSKEDMPAFLAQMERYKFQMDSLGTMGHLYRYLEVLK
ncbi:MAG: peptidoglycan DD-metalloendopeptidase family protein [Bacteroidales bacterium]|nr:peptidoglycan DD-metalloendopeptidase family protein [Bacteroidales bacterium]